MNKRCLLVYNIAGYKNDNTMLYINFMNGIKEQFKTFSGELKVIVSGNGLRPHTFPYLKKMFPEFDYINIYDNLPVNITFNKAVLEGIKRYGKFDHYIYMTADSLMDRGDEIEGMTNNMLKDTNIGMYSAQIDIDSCYAYGLKLGGGRHGIDDENARYEMFKDGTDYIVPPGRACAAHINIYSSDFFEFYERCCPDIFKGYCTESIFSFVNAAIKKHWVISKDFIIKHYAGMDGGSCGQDAEENRSKKPHTGGYDHPFYGDTLLHIFENEYAKSIGLGYEECQNVVIHDPSQFDENYFCINDKLKEYIKENLYLQKHQFDYEKINFDYEEGYNV